MSETANRKQLRLMTSRLFADAILANPALRESYAARTGWTTKSPVVPAEHDTTFGEVYKTVSQALTHSQGSVVAVPVLFWGREGQVSIEILTVRQGARPAGDLGSIDLDLINHSATMAQVCETLAPNKKWDMGTLDETARSCVAAYAN